MSPHGLCDSRKCHVTSNDRFISGTGDAQRQFLDASLIVVVEHEQQPNEHLVLDYRYDHNTLMHEGALIATHSGDIVNSNGGEHSIVIHLGKTPPNVVMYVVASAWVKTLREVVQPFLSIADAANGVEMCKYYLDEKDAAEKAKHTAVVLCRIAKKGRAWDVQAIGRMCGGNARDYAPVMSCIDAMDEWMNGRIDALT